MVTVRRALPQHEAQHCSTKTITAAQMQLLPQHQHQTPALTRLFWSAVEGFWMSWFTSDHDTFSTCDCQCIKCFAKPLLLGFYFVS